MAILQTATSREAAGSFLKGTWRKMLSSFCFVWPWFFSIFRNKTAIFKEFFRMRHGILVTIDSHSDSLKVFVSNGLEAFNVAWQVACAGCLGAGGDSKKYWQLMEKYINYVNDMLYYVGGAYSFSVFLFFDFYCVEVLPRLLGVNDAVEAWYFGSWPRGQFIGSCTYLERFRTKTWHDLQATTAAGILLIFGQRNITGNSKDLSKAGKEPIMSHKPSNFRLQNLQSFGSMLVLCGVWVTFPI